MKSSKIDRVVSVVVIGTCLIKAVLYGGSKPSSSTNEPPQLLMASMKTVTESGEAESFPLVKNQQFLIPHRTKQRSCVCLGDENLARGALSLQAEGIPLLRSVTNWTARGAYCDWLRVDFPSSFAFPHGTNLLTGVTLMAYGEIRESLHQLTTNNQQLTTLPMAVSIEPDVSSVSYGLTPSNSFLFTWSNVCENRDPTNRVEASIELFDSGAIAITTQPTNALPTTIYQLPTPPEGFVGEGQNEDWATNSFAFAAAEIATNGYSAWLSDYIGYNEPNGRYKVDVTIAALPDHGPCYLVVGPYKMVVTAPGTYSFPLEVFNEYRAYTCPTRVPLSFSYDDGYRIDEDASFGMPPAQSNNLNNPNNRTMLLASPGVPDYYIVCMVPHVYAVPSHIPLSQAVGARINLYCNYPGGTWSYRSYFSEHLRLTFGFPSYAEIETAEVADRVIAIMSAAGHECTGVFFIDPPPPNDDDPPHHQCCNACCGDACRCDGTCCLCNCGCHSSSNSSTNTTETTP